MIHRVGETPRLGVVVSHPIQYQAPLFRLLHARGNVDLEVLFLSDHGVRPSMDRGFGRPVVYDVPLLDGYVHRFIANRSPRPRVDRFAGLVNPGLVALIGSGAFDSILIHGYAHASDWIGALSAHKSRIPYMLRGESRLEGEAALSAAKRLAKQAAVGWLVRQAAACLPIGSENEQFYLAYGADADRLFSAPYSVDNERFRLAGDEGRETAAERLVKLGLDPRRRTIVFAAKLQAWKRPFDVLEAVSRLPEPLPNTIFIGDGSLRAALESRAQSMPHIRVLGFVNQQEIAEWYGVADVFVLPSTREPWGLAVNESMAAGAVPVVSDAVGCGPDLVANGPGRIFRAGDVTDLAKRLEEAMAESGPAAREAIRDRVDRFSLETTAVGIEAAARACGSVS